MVSSTVDMSEERRVSISESWVVNRDWIGTIIASNSPASFVCASWNAQVPGDC